MRTTLSHTTYRLHEFYYFKNNLFNKMAVAMDEEHRYGCLSRCSNGIVRLLETAFYKLGVVIGAYPWITIALSLSIAACCSVGMIRFKQESRNEKLWVPFGSPVLQHQRLVERYFPSENRFSQYIIEADNVLTTPVLQSMLVLHEDVLGITVGDDNWESLCFRHGPTCFATSLLELWSFDTAVINNLNQEDILEKINQPNLESPVYFTPVDIESVLGEITRDSTGRIIGARAAVMTWSIKAQGQGEGQGVFGDLSDPVGEAWESQFFEVRDELDTNTNDLMIYKFTRTALNEEASEIINGDSLLLAAGYTLVILYIIFAMSKFTRIEQKVYVSLAGMLTIGLSLISAMGLASAVGQSYGPIHSMLPFLLLGIGVDDMFVLVSTWYNLTEEEKQLEVREQVARSLQHSGVSITVTSITDFFAFLIGATTILPAMRSFCIYCGIGIIFLFFFSVTFFLSFLIIDYRRLENRRDACCCCYVYKENYKPSVCGQRTFLQEFFYKFYSPVLLTIPVKIIVILITFGVLGVCIWGTVTWEQNFDFRWLLPTDGETRAYFGATEKYFPSNGFTTAVYLETVDYFEERQAMNDLYDAFTNSKWIQASSTASWYESYQGWLNQTKVGDPGLNKDNWPQNQTLFYDWLDEFLSSPQGSRFNRDINMTADASLENRIELSRITGFHVLLKNSGEETTAMDETRSIANSANFNAGKDAAFAYSERYSEYESNKVIQEELLRNLGLASACVFIVIFILLASLWQTVLVFSCVIFTLIDLSGTLNFWGITIETSVAILLILAIGLAVDYAAHIGHTFMIFSGNRNDRTKETLGAMGPAVFNGGFSTFLAFLILSASSSYVFTTFFKVFFLVVVYGLFHGLVFLPVILSLVGPSPYLTAKPVQSSSPSLTSPKASTTAVTENIVDGTEMYQERRIKAVFNPAFVQDNDGGMRRVPAAIANGFMTQTHMGNQAGSWYRHHQSPQHQHHSRPLSTNHSHQLANGISNSTHTAPHFTAGESAAGRPSPAEQDYVGDVMI